MKKYKLAYFQDNLYMMMFLLPAGIMDGILAETDYGEKAFELGR